MPTIDLSTELYRTLQSFAVPFEDRSPEDVIWRLVREREAPPKKEATANRSSSASGSLLSAGVLIPNGLALRFTYKGRMVPAVVREGRIWIGDRAFSSPSSAAIAAADSLGSPGRSLNGWIHWEYQDDGKWRKLSELRKAEQTRKRSSRR